MNFFILIESIYLIIFIQHGYTRTISIESTEIISFLFFFLSFYFLMKKNKKKERKKEYISYIF